MEIVKTSINDVLLIKPKVFRDDRGYFVETWQKEKYSEIGLTLPFVQDNHSMSRAHILRGLHLQTNNPQGKLIMVSWGKVFDVAVDTRVGSPTFGKWFGVILSNENQFQLWIPPGLAHGFVVLSEMANFHYKCTDYYSPNGEISLKWNDPDIGIDWPIDFQPILSNKDKEGISLMEFIATTKN